jgi:hypothetical protein
MGANDVICYSLELNELILQIIFLKKNSENVCSLPPPPTKYFTNAINIIRELASEW